MVKVLLTLGEEYVEELRKRMQKSKPPISQAELGREMRPPVSASEVTRWFTKNPERRVSPQLATVQRIEEAMLRLQNRRARY